MRCVNLNLKPRKWERKESFIFVLGKASRNNKKTILAINITLKGEAGVFNGEERILLKKKRRRWEEKGLNDASHNPFARYLDSRTNINFANKWMAQKKSGSAKNRRWKHDVICEDFADKASFVDGEWKAPSQQRHEGAEKNSINPRGNLKIIRFPCAIIELLRYQSKESQIKAIAQALRLNDIVHKVDSRALFE